MSTVEILGFSYYLRNFEDEEKIQYFQDVLTVFTQYHQIRFWHEIQQMMYSIPEKTIKEAVMSLRGQLMYDYQELLHITTDLIKSDIFACIKTWEEMCERRKEEMLSAMDSYENKVELNLAIFNLKMNLEIIGSEAARAAVALLDNEEYLFQKPGSMAARKFDSQVRDVIYRALDEMNEEDREIIRDFFKM